MDTAAKQTHGSKIPCRYFREREEYVYSCVISCECLKRFVLEVRRKDGMPYPLKYFIRFSVGCSGVLVKVKQAHLIFWTERTLDLKSYTALAILYFIRKELVQR